MGASRIGYFAVVENTVYRTHILVKFSCRENFTKMCIQKIPARAEDIFEPRRLKGVFHWGKQGKCRSKGKKLR